MFAICFQQDFKYLQNYVRFKLGVAQKADGWGALQEAANSIPGDVKFANLQLQTCVDEFHFTEEEVLNAETHDAIQDYSTYENLAANGKSWFR